MKKHGFLFFGLMFAGIGTLLLIIGLCIFINSSSFVSKSSDAKGVVVRLESHNSSNETSTNPIIKFSTENNTYEFESNISANYSIGEHVNVLFNPYYPQDARINSFVALYLIPTILSGVGGVFAIIGYIVLIKIMKSRNRLKWLKQNGIIIQAKVEQVIIDTHFSVNDQHPYRIIATYKSLDKKSTFKSEHIWVDPKKYINQGLVEVYVDPNNYDNYFVITE
jgi:hypothetical protein